MVLIFQRFSIATYFAASVWYSPLLSSRQLTSRDLPKGVIFCYLCPDQSLNRMTKKESYLVEGMTCSGCERAIQRIVANLQGVETSKADLQSASLEVSYDPNAVTIDEIKTAVNKIGYKIVGEVPEHGQRERRDDAVS